MTISRNKDVITNADDLEHLFTFEQFPVFMGCTEAPPDTDLKNRMSFWISKTSGMIQLNPLLSLDVLYPESRGAGLVGSSWENHHKEFSKFIATFDPKSVLEIGGGHGVLATTYQAITKIPWTIVEPNPTLVAGCEAKIIRRFFEMDFQIENPPKTIVHSHLFEHIYDPSRFIQTISAFLPLGGMLIFSVPNMKVMLERRYTNTMNFEHTIYLSEDYIDYLLNQHGFAISQKVKYLDDHSLFYAARRSNERLAVELPKHLYRTNRRLYTEYIQHHRLMIHDFNVRIMQHPNNDIFLFGAHVQSQYLMAFGLHTARVRAILDNDPNKRGKRLYGTDKFVVNPIALREFELPLVVLRAGTFTREIIEQIASINPFTKIVT